MASTRIRGFDSITLKKYDGMMGRCYRQSEKGYRLYGGRGIRVCAAWIRDVGEFRRWVLGQLGRQQISIESFIESPRQSQLDRIDVNGHYSPDNCRFVSPQGSARNRRVVENRRFVSAEGEEIVI